MSIRNHALAVLASALALAASPTAQTSGGGQPGGNAGAGGAYSGPGDTVPGGGGQIPTVGPLLPGGRVTGGAGSRPGSISTPGRPVVLPRIPPPGMPGSPWNTPEETPNGRPVVTDDTSWQHWWHYNRWAYLEVERGVLDGTRTGSGGFFLGRGQRIDPETPELSVSAAEMRDLVHPAMVAVLERGGSPDLQSLTLLALAKLRNVQVPVGQKRLWQIAPRFFTDPNQSVVERAVLALGVRGEPRFLRWLESILADEPDGQARLGGSGVTDSVRAFAAYSLGLLGERSPDMIVRARAHAGLSRALHGDVPQVQAAALVAMAHVPLGWKELDPDRAPGLLLAARERSAQIAEIQAFFVNEDANELTRAHAPNALARLLQGAPEELRASVALTLLESLAPKARTSRELQNGAVLALGQIGNSGGLGIDRRIREELERISTQSGHHRLTRYMATIALAQVASRQGPGEEPFLGLEPARELFLRQLTRHRGQALCWSALALGLLEQDAAARGEMPSPDVTGGLRRMLLRNRTPEVAGAAAIALGLIRDIESVPALYERMLETGEAHVRGYTALALGMIGARHVAAGVHEVLAEASHQPFALQQAAIGLGLLGDPETGAVLFTMLSKTSDPEVQASLASGLGWLGDPRPVGPLVGRLEDGSLGAAPRAWTAVALGRICDADPWPWVGRWSVGVNYDAQLTTLIEDDFQSGLLDLP